MTEWKDISTAPKDSRNFLVYDANKNYGYNIAFYDYDNKFYLMDDCMKTIDINDYTHWMELPKPPIPKHHCKNQYYQCLSKNGQFLVNYTAVDSLSSYYYTVNYCPICGEKAND